MNAPEQQVVAGASLTSSRDGLFSAYTNEQRQRVTRRQILAATLLLGVFGSLAYVVVTYQPARKPFRVDTYNGVRRVVQGMTPQEVSGILGPPVGREMRGDQECFQYGRATLRAAGFILNTLCYVDGKLQEVSARRYNSWIVSNDGSIVPAPLEPGELEETLRSAPEAPGLAGDSTP